MDYKEYARQLRENAVKDDNGVIRCSPELWERIASIIENIDTSKSNTNQHGNSELKSELKDEEIIKALPTVAYGGHSCNKCKYRRIANENRCGLKGCFITRNALYLINRQKPEIKLLKADKEALINGQITLQKCIAEKMVEIEEKATEIDILIKKKAAAYDEVAELKAEVERLKESRDKLYEEMAKRQKEEVAIAKRMSKSEAIKEFWEKLKEKELPLLHSDDYSICAIPTIYGDNLLRKMTEFKE